MNDSDKNRQQAASVRITSSRRCHSDWKQRQ